MEEMMKFLADAPAEQRKIMIKSRIEMFLSADETNRRNGMREMITALSKLKPEQRRRLVAARSLAIAELLPDKQQTIMASRAALAKELPPEVNGADMTAVMETLSEIPAGQRLTFMDSMKKAMEAAGMQLPTQAA